MSLKYESECDLEIDEELCTRANTPNKTFSFENKLAFDKGQVTRVSPVKDVFDFKIETKLCSKVMQTEVVQNDEILNEIKTLIADKNEALEKQRMHTYVAPKPIKETRLMSSTAILSGLFK